VERPCSERIGSTTAPLVACHRRAGSVPPRKPPACLGAASVWIPESGAPLAKHGFARAVDRRSQECINIIMKSTDTKRASPALPNQFFFWVFLKHRTTVSYGTFDASEYGRKTNLQGTSDCTLPSERQSRLLAFRRATRRRMRRSR